MCLGSNTPLISADLPYKPSALGFYVRNCNVYIYEKWSGALLSNSDAIRHYIVNNGVGYDTALEARARR